MVVSTTTICWDKLSRVQVYIFYNLCLVVRSERLEIAFKVVFMLKAITHCLYKREECIVVIMARKEESLSPLQIHICHSDRPPM
ncbi:hypothetical protein PV325_002385 [Microctonus aethiopoides]|nr:hypothetical protein PV325_002385 [Microctonus aethiopoides]